ncbi:unnamed protein product [Cuscuta campestris]|uniref:Uncharacterized protein n=2 Tax=Cuscuta sect. Cleistogrammica TaxID=1824901 RepID=A0A484N3R3_9ASTE|nr:hypothetical protein DM860_012389 [Cuscuta australis]VFQ95931.1 unnamed protein product [Cuscuta campestris]
MAWWRKLISLRSKIYGEGSLDSLQAHKIFPIGGGVQENQVQLLAEKNASSSPPPSVEDNKTGTAFPKKEKDWKTTLASRLLEESPRSSVYSGEGMDLLWERYEINDSIKMNSSRREEEGEEQTKKKSKKTMKNERCQKGSRDDDNEEEEEVKIGQLCCLQALKKLSTGKGSSFGMMGSSNLVKISKALKGFGWVRRVSKMVVHVEDRF